MTEIARKDGALEVLYAAPPLVFATGSSEGIAAVLEASAGGVPRLTAELARNLASELDSIAVTTARRVNECAKAFTTLASGLGERHNQFTAQALTSLLVFDGLVSPAARRLVFGDCPPASVIAVEAEASASFSRTCVRPGDHEIAAVFCCGAGFPQAVDLHSIFSDRAVRRALSTVGPDGSIVIDEPARRQLNRVAGIEQHVAYAEYSVRSVMPVLTSDMLEQLHSQALALAGALLQSGDSPRHLCEALADAGKRGLPGFAPQDAFEATLGVFYHAIAREWREFGTWVEPPRYALLDPDGRRAGSLFLIKLEPDRLT